jgi:hypothetical protein
MLYVALATALLVWPEATAIALMVVGPFTVTIVHTGELEVGVLPLVVQWITAPEVLSEIATEVELV